MSLRDNDLFYSPQTRFGFIGESPEACEVNHTDLPQDDGIEAAPVTISGVPAILSKQTHWARRISWAIVLIVCFSITLAQCYERILFYLSTPVTVNVQIQRNHSLRFPAVTVCNKNVYNLSNLQTLLAIRDIDGVTVATRLNERNETPTLAHVVSVGNMTSDAVWTNTAHNIHLMLIECWFGRGMTCNMRGTWKAIYTVAGVCFTYELKDGTVSTSGMFNNMYMKMTETTPIIKSSEVGWKIHLHDPKDIPVLDIQTHGFTVLPGWSKDVRLQIRDFRTLNTKQRPCDDSESYSMSKCTTRCFSDELLRKAGCLLPYVANVIPNAPTCETPSSYVAAEKAAKELFFSGQWNPNDCLCARSCDQTYFTPHGEAVLSNENASRIRIYYQEMTYDDISESFAYTEIPLLCDIGGALGLMLGASVLTFVEVLETFWSFVLKFRGKTKRKTKSAKSNHSFMPT